MRKLLYVFLFVFAIGVAVTLKSRSQTQQARIQELQRSPERGTLKWQVQMARAKGESRVIIPAPPAEYATNISSIDQALSYLGMVVAQPIAKNTYLTPAGDDYEIRTWYKFKVLERLSPGSLPKCATCSYSAELPQELLPINENEILIDRYAGTSEIDGMSVTVVDRQIPDFAMGTKYVLLLATDQSGRLGLLRSGPAGIYGVDPSGTLRPQNPSHSVAREIQTRFNNSLDQLRVYAHQRGVAK